MKEQIKSRSLRGEKQSSAKLYCCGKRKKLLTPRLLSARLCAANEILKEDISLIKAHKGHP